MDDSVRADLRKFLLDMLPQGESFASDEWVASFPYLQTFFGANKVLLKALFGAKVNTALKPNGVGRSMLALCNKILAHEGRVLVFKETANRRIRYHAKDFEGALCKAEDPAKVVQIREGTFQILSKMDEA